MRELTRFSIPQFVCLLMVNDISKQVFGFYLKKRKVLFHKSKKLVVYDGSPHSLVEYLIHSFKFHKWISL
jgi:hypothetical protein